MSAWVRCDRCEEFSRPLNQGVVGRCFNVFCGVEDLRGMFSKATIPDGAIQKAELTLSHYSGCSCTVCKPLTELSRSSLNELVAYSECFMVESNSPCHGTVDYRPIGVNQDQDDEYAYVCEGHLKEVG